MLVVPSYGKILTLGSSYTENALKGEVVVQEKLDGSMFGFGVNENGELVARSKGCQQRFDSYDKMFNNGMDYLKSIKKKILKYCPDTYFYGEYIQKPKHNVLAYKKHPRNYICLFDAIHEGKWMTRKELEDASVNLDVDVIPELFKGLIGVAGIKELLTTKSYLGDQIIEGVVIKNKKETIMLGNNLYPLNTKYVREEFKEKHTKEWKIKRPKGAIEDIIEGYRSEARWQKAVIHAKEEGKLENAVQDIGPLMKMAQQDLEAEEKENIKEALWKALKGKILRRSVAGLPQWYKKELLKNLKEKNGKK